MIIEQTQGLYPAANVVYYGFGSGQSFISGPTTPATAFVLSDKQFIGEIQQLGPGSNLDTNMGIV